MKELEKVNKVIGKHVPNAPHETLLVIDATTGQNGISQAKAFKEITDITGIVLTKLDGTAKGGIVLAIKEDVNIPVKFVGLGEKPDDLQEFDARAYRCDIDGRIELQSADVTKNISGYLGEDGKIYSKEYQTYNGISQTKIIVFFC